MLFGNQGIGGFILTQMSDFNDDELFDQNTRKCSSCTVYMAH